MLTLAHLRHQQSLLKKEIKRREESLKRKKGDLLVVNKEINSRTIKEETNAKV